MKENIDVKICPKTEKKNKNKNFNYSKKKWDKTKVITRSKKITDDEHAIKIFFLF